MHFKSGWALILQVGLVLIIAVGVSYFYLQNQKSNYSTPDELMFQLKLLCGNDDYQNVALNSLKYMSGNYQLIDNSDIVRTNDDLSYLGAANGLCREITSDSTLMKKKISDTQWEYRYVFSSAISHTYEITLFNNEWRVVLYKPMRL
ncbi:MAG: hypothetical protein V1487_02885 [bacterium]